MFPISGVCSNSFTSVMTGAQKFPAFIISVAKIFNKFFRFALAGSLLISFSAIRKTVVSVAAMLVTVLKWLIIK